MERESDNMLVAVPKPVRGREMIASAIPTDMFHSMRLVSAKRANKDEDLTSEISVPRKNNVETYYEGYVDGKKYLVPDSNLEAMKDVINLGMRQRRSTSFRHQTSMDVEDEMTLDRIEKMLNKIKDLKLSLSGGESGSSSKLGEPVESRKERVSEQWSQMTSLTKEENESKQRSRRPTKLKLESESRSESQKSSSPRSRVYSQEDGFASPESSSLSTDKSVSSEYESKEQQSVVEQAEEEESDDCYLRLVLSGHFKNNEKPIYIIQEYNTKSKIFCKESADFTSSQTEGNVHIFMAGKIFEENILGETDGKPTSLNLKPNKIIIDPSKCKIFRSYFENTYSRKATDITIKGEFLQNERSMDITPFLSLSIKHKIMNLALSNVNSEEKSEEKRPSILVRNRQSETSGSTEIPKDFKRVSFKESSDDEEVHVIYKNTKKKRPDDSLPTQVNYAKKESFLQNGLNEYQRSREHKQIIAKRKVLERIFYLITENSLFKKLFTKRK